jgi:hypothetical protein
MVLLRIFKSNRELVRENLELMAKVKRLEDDLANSKAMAFSNHICAKESLINEIQYQKDIKWLNNCLRWFAIDVQDYKYGKEAIRRHEARAYARANSKNSNKETV